MKSVFSNTNLKTRERTVAPSPPGTDVTLRTKSAATDLPHKGVGGARGRIFAAKFLLVRFWDLEFFQQRLECALLVMTARYCLVTFSQNLEFLSVTVFSQVLQILLGGAGVGDRCHLCSQGAAQGEMPNEDVSVSTPTAAAAPGDRCDPRVPESVLDSQHRVSFSRIFSEAITGIH